MANPVEVVKKKGKGAAVRDRSALMFVCVACCLGLLCGAPTGDRFGTFGDEGRTGIDEAGVELEQLCARLHLFNGILRRHDAAGGDDRKGALNVFGDEANDFRGALAKRC